MHRIMHALVLAALPAAVNAQELEQRVLKVGNGTVHLSFAARPRGLWRRHAQYQDQRGKRRVGRRL